MLKNVFILNNYVAVYWYFKCICTFYIRFYLFEDNAVSIKWIGMPEISVVSHTSVPCVKALRDKYFFPFLLDLNLMDEIVS